MKKKLLVMLLSLAMAVGFSTVAFADDSADTPEVGNGGDLVVAPPAEETPVEEPTVGEPPVGEPPVEEEPTTSYVAMIGEVGYETLDDAVKVAKKGDIVVVKGENNLTINLASGKDLTFTGNGTINIEKQTAYFTGNITIDGNGLVLNWKSGTEGSWLVMSLSGEINVLNGATWHMAFSPTDGADTNALYMNTGAAINVDNGSKFEIVATADTHHIGQAIQLDAANKSYINVTNGSSFVIDGLKKGYTNSPVIKVNNSTFKVINCAANASNGGLFTAKDSSIEISGNRGHGLSTTNIVFENSVVNCNDNGYVGLTATSGISIDKNSKVYVKGNSWNGIVKAAFRIMGGDCTIEDGAVVEITDNYLSGVQIANGATMNMAKGIITRNGNVANVTNPSATLGGGIYNLGTLTLGQNVRVYNNHAATAGDDIYSENGAKISFGNVGANLYLDGQPDCTDLITGWYKDGMLKEAVPTLLRQTVAPVEPKAPGRWNAHKDKGEVYAEKFEPGEYEGLVAVKAAHGERIDVPFVPNPDPIPTPTPDPEPTPEPDPVPPVDIDDPDSPLDETPDVTDDVEEGDVPEEETTEVPEEDTPLSDVPKTGDEMQLGLYLVVLGMAGTTVALTSRKRRDEK